ncbi:MAG: Gfo/Idh/MocA family protein [Armatimonadota bacterium]
MSDRIYTVAITGCGKRGKVHADLFNKNPRFEVVGVNDVDNTRMEECAALAGSPRMFTDTAEMLAATKPDVYCFCTPPSVRLPLIKLAVENGVKLVAYEKPMATSMSEAIEIRTLLNDAGVKSVQSHQRKYNPQFKAVKELIESGALGRVHTVYAHCLGWMMHMNTHLADYMSFLNGWAEAEWVIGQAHGREKLADNHPSPDYIGGFIQYANGVRGIIEVGSLAPDVPEVDYWWRKVRIGAQGTEGFAECFVGAGWRACTKSRGYEEHMDEGTWDADNEQVPYIEDIALWLDGTKEHPCNGESAYKDQEIMCGLIRSVAARGKIDFPLGPGEPELEVLDRVLP